MKVTFYFRSPDMLNRSIERVFEAVSRGLARNFEMDIHNVFASAGWIWPVSVVKNMLRMGMRSRRAGVNHITGDIHYVALFMPRRRTVLTIHDLVSLHNRQLNPAFRRFVYYLWYYLPLRHLKYITCVSEATRKDLVKFFPFAENKITVISNPISDSFSAMEPACNAKPVILHIGTRSNKNLERVIQALASLNCHLRIIGKLTPAQEQLLAVTGVEYSNAYGISDEEMIDEYRKCDIVSFPSLFEGFGMPIIEGQACGRVVVSSNLEPMKNISAGASVLVDPEDVESIYRGFESVMADTPFRRSLVAKGLKNAANYTIDSIVSKYKELYDRVMS